MTATAILKLVEAGRLELDDPISKHLPDVPDEHEEVTILHLLTHTAGWPREGPTGSGDNLEQAMQGYLAAPRRSKPGTRFTYHNGGYAMLAAIVQLTAGEPYEDWVRRELFEPAGLVQTDFVDTVRFDRDLLATTPDGERTALDYIRGWGYRGMGGVITSVDDVARWIAAVHDGTLLVKSSRTRLFRPELADYALGWYVLDTPAGNRCHQHSGGTRDFASYIRHFVEKDVLIVVLTSSLEMNWQVAWGLSAIAVGEDPVAPAPPELAKLKSKTRSSLTRSWIGDDRVLSVAPEGGGFRCVLSGPGDEEQASVRVAPTEPYRLESFAFSEERGYSLELSKKGHRLTFIDPTGVSTTFEPR